MSLPATAETELMYSCLHSRSRSDFSDREAMSTRYSVRSLLPSISIPRRVESLEQYLLQQIDDRVRILLQISTYCRITLRKCPRIQKRMPAICIVLNKWR